MKDKVVKMLFKAHSYIEPNYCKSGGFSDIQPILTNILGKIAFEAFVKNNSSMPIQKNTNKSGWEMYWHPHSTWVIILQPGSPETPATIKIYRIILPQDILRIEKGFKEFIDISKAMTAAICKN